MRRSKLTVLLWLRELEEESARRAFAAARREVDERTLALEQVRRGQEQSALPAILPSGTSAPATTLASAARAAQALLRREARFATEVANARKRESQRLRELADRRARVRAVERAQASRAARERRAAERRETKRLDDAFRSKVQRELEHD